MPFQNDGSKQLVVHLFAAIASAKKPPQPAVDACALLQKMPPSAIIN